MRYRSGIKNLTLAALAAGAFYATPATAAITDPLIEGAKLCTRHLPRYEREYGIPTHLLSAIASTESGRYHNGLKIKVPWPWTINANGKGYFFDSKDEAIAAARKLRANGTKSMDVGCMQVNLHHHPEAFSSLDQAFEPEYNIAYAASFLRGLYQDDGSWKRAASYYHSKTPTLGNQYVGLVYNSWFEIIDKLRTARLAVPESSVAALNAMKTEPAITRVASVTPSASPKKASYKTASYQTAQLTVPRSEKRNSVRDDGIIVIPPTDRASARSEETMTVAQAHPAILDAPARLTPASATASSADSHKNGPRFIFSD